jgi:hypothetical protein
MRDDDEDSWYLADLLRSNILFIYIPDTLTQSQWEQAVAHLLICPWMLTSGSAGGVEFGRTCRPSLSQSGRRCRAPTENAIEDVR